MRLSLLFFAVAVLASAPVSAAVANHTLRSKPRHAWQKPRLQPDRDCVPLNGRYGYYGNPWCDTGSSRPPDIAFRERYGGRAR